MEKKFKLTEDYLEVVVEHGDRIFLPTENGQVDIGSFEQTTVQQIDTDKIPELKSFVEGEVEKANKQLAEINKQLDSFDNVIELDEELVEACRRKISTGTKVFKQKMLTLNNHLEKITRCRALKLQKEYIEKQLVQMNKELDGLNKAIN